MTKPILSIIIVNWNTRTHLKWCLRYIYTRTKGINFEVFVVDNASHDNSAVMVEKNYPSVKLIRNQTNLGFAKANNQAIRQAKGKYILLLNSDTKITEQALVKMVRFMEENNKVGILGCKLLNPDGTLQPSCRQFPSLFSQVIILLKLHNIFPNLKSIRNYYLLDWPHDTTKKVDQVMGACFMVRQEVFTKIGLLDKKYFIWFEEVDFCRRAAKAGWSTYFLPQAEVCHEKGASFNQVLSPKKQAWFNKSVLRYFRQHEPLISYLVLLNLYPTSMLLAIIAQALHSIKPSKKKKYL
ncbi:glycosyltransferase family 2 protein [Patescibacteria group bacterium]|nr:glycosyltransferase family 2 protein [Patescibacteria group bacterium]